MPKSPANDLSTFLRRQTADALADVLLTLAESSEPARRRLERWQLADRPDKLAATFRTQLAGWKRARRFLDHSEARAFAQDLSAWLAQVADELLPRDPGAALDLLEAFIQTDAAWFERADDSDGAIADAVRQACGLWLEAAARCESPAAQWPARLITLYDSDGYGGREPLLRHADRLLDEPGLRQLVAVYEQRLEQVLSRPSDGSAAPIERYAVSAALSLLSEALGDPGVHVRAVLRHSPQPNELQKEHFARAFLQAGQPTEALAWLDGHWGRHEPSRLSLQAAALAALGRPGEAADRRRQLFESTLSVHDLQQWLALLPEAEQPGARALAREMARGRTDVAAVAMLLLALDDAAAADEALVQPGRGPPQRSTLRSTGAAGQGIARAGLRAGRDRGAARVAE